MSTKMRISYDGDLHTTAIHKLSGTSITTDAPLDNGGKGTSFSPTDLLATALTCCALTIIGLKAEDLGLNLQGVQAKTEKIMVANPRRVAEVIIDFYFPEAYDARTQTIIEKTAHLCPVAQSVSAELKQTFRFHFGESA